jgi:hypothetical protein
MRYSAISLHGQGWGCLDSNDILRSDVFTSIVHKQNEEQIITISYHEVSEIFKHLLVNQ